MKCLFLCYALVQKLRGLNSNLAFKRKRFLSIREKSDNIYFTQTELDEIEHLNLSANDWLGRVRDLFLIGCHTGLRYSDFSVLKPENIKDGYIEIKQSKIGGFVVIPVHTIIEKIIRMYQGNLPAAISN
jgi:hypothetical protein